MSLRCFGIILALWVTASHGNSEGYEFFPKIDMLYKFHSTPQNWSHAIKTCFQEGATLAMPINAEESAALGALFNRHQPVPVSGSPKFTYMFSGFHDIFSEGEYITLKGLPVQYYFHKWRTGQPDNYKNEDCGSIDRSGLLNDLNCVSASIFTCQKEIFPCRTMSDGYEPDDRAYIYAPHLRSMYKIHLNIKKWAEARVICESEGGYLAIINSASERDFLVKMLSKPENKIHYAVHPEFALLGFHDQFENGDFITVEGNPLQSTGFAEWAADQPNNIKDEDCGSMHSNGFLHDFPCQVPAVFICEKS